MDRGARGPSRRRHQLKEKYAVLWLTASVPVAVLAVFPGLLDAGADVLEEVALLHLQVERQPPPGS